MTEQANQNMEGNGVTINEELEKDEMIVPCTLCKGVGVTTKMVSTAWDEKGIRNDLHQTVPCKGCLGSGSLVVKLIRPVRLDPLVYQWIHGKPDDKSKPK